MRAADAVSALGNSGFALAQLYYVCFLVESLSLLTACDVHSHAFVSLDKNEPLVPYATPLAPVTRGLIQAALATRARIAYVCRREPNHFLVDANCQIQTSCLWSIVSWFGPDLFDCAQLIGRRCYSSISVMPRSALLPVFSLPPCGFCYFSRFPVFHLSPCMHVVCRRVCMVSRRRHCKWFARAPAASLPAATTKLR